MFKKRKDKTVPLLAYWTRLYVLVLLLSLLGITAISGIWVWTNTYSHQYELLELQALQLAEVFERTPEIGFYPGRFLHEKPPRQGQMGNLLLVQIIDQQGNIYEARDPRGPKFILPNMQETPASYQEVLSGNTVRERVKLGSETWLRVGMPLTWNGEEPSALYVSSPTRDVLNQILHLYGALALMTVVIGLASWLVLYFLSRKLTRPLLQVADATRAVAEGDYNPVLPQQLKERELQQMVASFKHMIGQLQSLEQLRTDLLAGVSHELRTPITSIRGMIQAVQDKVVEGEQADNFLSISLSESKRLQLMVEQLLDFSSLDSGASPIENEEVNLSELVEEVVQQLSVLPEYSEITFLRTLPEEDVLVKGDNKRLRQVMFNLFSNSRKASASEIKINLEIDGNIVNFEVQDNGKGISPEEQPYIFERFYRGGDGKVKSSGLGLGLTISSLLARDHGGKLVLKESSPQGTTFSLILPHI